MTSFIKRFVRSKFGFGYLYRKISLFFGQREIVSRLLGAKRENGITQVLQSRKELSMLLAGPALINDPEVSLLQQYSSLAQKLIVEIGCAYGGSSLLFLLKKNNEARLVSIDPFIKDSMGEFQASQKKCFHFVSKALRLLNMGDRVKDWKIIPDYSFNVIKNWNDLIDVLFIDGDHTYEAVKQDFEDWFPAVAKDGFILFHDSRKPNWEEDQKLNMGWPGPSRLVNELMSDNRVSFVESAGTISVFKKNE